MYTLSAMKKTSIFSVTKTFTPLFNTPYIKDIFGGQTGSSVQLDEQGFIRPLETILFPETTCEILDSLTANIVQVNTAEYPYEGTFFTDIRFLDTHKKESHKNIMVKPSKSTPPLNQILQGLLSIQQKGTRYCWGGNCPQVPEMLQLYPPATALPTEIENDWTLKGFDCSGLMYYLTHGATPRNTSSWVHFGQGIHIEGKNISSIIDIVKPLDAIVWKGHILFVFDSIYTIESRANQGVILTKIQDRLEEICFDDQREGSNTWKEGKEKQFLLRRWHPHFVV